MGTPKLTKAELEQRRIKALQLRMAGYSYDQIGQQLGYSNASGAQKAVMSILHRYQKELAAQYKMIEGQRLEELQSAVWAKAIYGNQLDAEFQLKCMDRVLKIMKRRADMYGLDTDKKLVAELVLKGRVEVIWNPEKHRDQESTKTATSRPKRSKSKPPK